MRPLAGKELSSYEALGSPRVQGRAGKTVDRSRQPEILNPPPIGHFIEFLLRVI